MSRPRHRGTRRRGAQAGDPDTPSSAAAKLGGDVHVLVVGADAQGAAEAAAKIAGVSKVLLADAPHYAHADWPRTWRR